MLDEPGSRTSLLPHALSASNRHGKRPVRRPGPHTPEIAWPTVWLRLVFQVTAPWGTRLPFLHDHASGRLQALDIDFKRPVTLSEIG